MTTEPRFKFGGPEGLLAHYTKAAVTFEDILPTGKLRMSPYRKMRDPAENQDLLPGTAFFGERSDEEALGAVFGVAGLIKEVRDSVRVLSFTHDAPLVGRTFPTFAASWARPRMWEQYGDDHRGACLVFDADRLEEALQREFARQAPEAPYHLGNVVYTPGGIAESELQRIIDDRIFDAEHRHQAVADYIDRHNEDFFFLKTDDWATEYEYRAVFQRPDDDYAFVGYGDALVAVIVGYAFPPWQRPGAREACAEAGIELHRMRWKRSPAPVFQLRG